jgi:serine/threonine-protein kinase
MLGILTGIIVLVYALVRAGSTQQQVKGKAAEQSVSKKRVSTIKPMPEVSREVRIQLNEARQLLNSNNLPEALAAYKVLSQQQVPEAMYVYGKLALQNRNKQLNCADAFQLLVSSANNGYVPAKRTVGFLYSFADDDNALKSNFFYERCKFIKDVAKGSKLLMEATLQGDTDAVRFLEDLNAKQ